MAVTVFGWLSRVVGLIRMVFPAQLTGIMASAVPTLPVVLPMIGAVFRLVGGFLSFKAYGR